MIYDVINASTGAVVNQIVLLDPSGWTPPEGCTIREAQGAFNVPTAVHPIPATVPLVISDRQFFQQLAVQGVITQDEAIAAVATGTLPSSMATLVNMLPPDQQFAANMLLKGATQFERSNPMVPVLGQAYGWNAAQLDQLWIAASLL